MSVELTKQSKYTLSEKGKAAAVRFRESFATPTAVEVTGFDDNATVLLNVAEGAFSHASPVSDQWADALARMTQSTESNVTELQALREQESPALRLQRLDLRLLADVGQFLTNAGPMEPRSRMGAAISFGERVETLRRSMLGLGDSVNEQADSRAVAIATIRDRSEEVRGGLQARQTELAAVSKEVQQSVEGLQTVTFPGTQPTQGDRIVGDLAAAASAVKAIRIFDGAIVSTSAAEEHKSVEVIVDQVPKITSDLQFLTEGLTRLAQGGAPNVVSRTLENMSVVYGRIATRTNALSGAIAGYAKAVEATKEVITKDVTEQTALARGIAQAAERAEQATELLTASASTTRNMRADISAAQDVERRAWYARDNAADEIGRELSQRIAANDPTVTSSIDVEAFRASPSHVQTEALDKLAAEWALGATLGERSVEAIRRGDIRTKNPTTLRHIAAAQEAMASMPGLLVPLQPTVAQEPVVRTLP